MFLSKKYAKLKANVFFMLLKPIYNFYLSPKSEISTLKTSKTQSKQYFFKLTK